MHSKMSSDKNCTICLTDLNTDQNIESIFSIDSEAKTCLAYKIFQMTGIQMIQQNVGEFTCLDCHDMLITIVQLEKEFAAKFHMLAKDANSTIEEASQQYAQPLHMLDKNANSSPKFKKEIHSPKTPELNLEERYVDFEMVNEYSKDPYHGFEEYKTQQNINRFLNSTENLTSEMEHAKVPSSDLQEAVLQYSEATKKGKNNELIQRNRKSKSVKRKVTNSKNEEPSAEDASELSDGEVNATNETLNINKAVEISVNQMNNTESKASNPSRINENLEFQRKINNLKRIDSDKNPYWQCDFCDKTFNRRDGVISHRRSIHTGEKPYVGKECEKAFADNSNLDLNDRDNQNLMKHDEVQYSVQNSDLQEPDCTNTEATKEYKNEMSIRRKRKGKPAKRQCQKSKKEKSSVEESAELSEGEVIETNVTVSITEAEENSFNQAKSRAYKSHAPETEAFNSSGINEKFEFQHYINNLKQIDTDGKEFWQCDYCEKGFARRDGLITHRRSLHTGEKPYVCKDCGKAFADNSNHRQHVKLHSSIKGYRKHNPKLTALNRSRINEKLKFQQKISNLRQIDEDGKEYFQCDFCEKTFKRREGVIAHRRTFHTGERPYECKECGKTFADNSNYHHHVKFHVKPYKCENCPKTFAKNHHLKTHLLNCYPC